MSEFQITVDQYIFLLFWSTAFLFSRFLYNLRRMRPRHRFIQTLLLLLLITIAYGLRLHHLDSYSFWTDEGLTAWRADYSVPEILSNTITIQEGSGKDTHPPFYYLLIHFSQKAWGDSDFSMRYLSLLAGVLLVPLLYQFGRHLSGAAGGMVAAGLTAVNPLQIWYAQEARMYTLVILLAASASYLLWRMLVTNKWRRYLPPYLLFAGLMLYTHYSAVFLIAVQALFVVWLLWRNGQRRLVAGTAVLLTLITLPLIPVTIPRLFTGAESAYNRVPPLVVFQDAIRQFSLGITVDFSQPLVQLLVIGTAVLLLIGLISYPTWQHRLFLSGYLLAAPVGIIVLSVIKPMYLGVRHSMIGSPALMLILAQAVVWLAFSMQKSTSPSRKVGWGVAVAFAVAILTISPAIAVNNLYNDGHYTKDNFRDLIRYIEQTAGENDIIIYNDAVLLATHAHYQQRTDLPVTAVPIYPKHIQNSIEPLPDLVAAYDRIWFLTDPPDDGRDADPLVQNWLDENTERLGTHNTYGRGALLQVITYATVPTQTATLPPSVQPLNIEWINAPTLVGIESNFEQPTALSTLWVDLFWQGDSPVPSLDQQLRLILRGEDGVDWVVSDHDLRTMDWEIGQHMRESYPIAIPSGTPSGEYALFVQPVGAEAQLATTIQLAASDRLPDRPAIIFQNGLTLVDAVHPADIHPGHPLPLALYWQKNEPLSHENLQYNLQVIAPDGTLFKEISGAVAPDWLDEWAENSPIVTYTGIYFPPDAIPAQYEFRWQLRDGDGDGDGVVKGRPFYSPFNREQINFDEVEVTPWPLEANPPIDALVTRAKFGDDIDLYGYNLEQTADELNVSLYWQTIAPPAADYFSFIHLLNEEGEIVAQQAFAPVGGLRPTMGWRAGELLTDGYTIPLPPDLPSGEYQLIAGLFEPETWKRPFVTHQNEHQIDDQFVLETIEIRE